MERLTLKGGICEMVSTEYCHKHRDCYECGHGRKVFKRLAAYEDTGLEPEENTAAADRRHNCKIDCLLARYNELDEKYNALKEAEQKRQAGCVRCESPCQTCMIGCFKQEPDTCGGYTLPPMQYFCKTCGRDLRGESYDDNR